MNSLPVCWLSLKTTDAYHKWVEWSDEDGAYIGKCPDLISGIHGDDPVRVYADLAREIGGGSEFQHTAAAAAALPQPPRAGQPALAEVPLADLF